MNRAKYDKIRQERRLLEREPIPDILITWPNNSLDKLVAEIKAPESSLYHDDILTVELTMLKYPDEPPRAVMKTPIFHPNIDANGAIRVAALRSQFGKTVSLRAILLEVVHALENPNPDDELNIHAAHLLKTNPDAFEERVRDQVLKNCAERGS
jgi:ubiquitin-protein ligase